MATSVESLAEFRSYVAALRDAFAGKPWHQVAEKASRMWQRCGLEDRMPWDQARNTVRNAFLRFSPVPDHPRWVRSFGYCGELQDVSPAALRASNTRH